MLSFPVASQNEPICTSLSALPRNRREGSNRRRASNRSHSCGLDRLGRGLRIVLICCLPIALSGCGNTFYGTLDKTPATGAVLSLNLDDVEFGDVVLNTAATQSVTLASSGTAPLTVTSATLTGSGFALSGPSFPVTINAGQTVSLAVQFVPSTMGQVTGQLTIASNSSTNGTTVISLSGTGTPPAAALSSLSCDSGTMTGAGADACKVTLTSAASSSGLTVNLSSSNSAVIVPSAVAVPAGATSAGFTATVQPVGSAQSVSLTAKAGSISKNLALHLNAAVPTLSINATSVGFGNVVVNTTATQSLTLTSTGTVPVTINSAALTGVGFSISGVGFPVTLNPGQTAILGLQFDPTATDAAMGQLTIASNSTTNGTAVISLSGTGTPPPAALNLLSCSSGAVTGAGTDTCTVTLTAAAPSAGLTVNLSSSSSNVTVPSAVTIPPGAASAEFTATVASVKTAQAVTITASVGSMFTSFTMQLNATILALSINPSSVAFGNVVVNTPTMEQITLTSTGTAPVTINEITLMGTGFTLSGPALPITLTPNQTTTVDLSFDPTAAGAATGQLTILSNASANGTAVVGLTGTGAVATVAITPASASTSFGATQQFAASVAGTSSTAVTWTVSGTGCSGKACGTISSTGLYTAPTMEPSSATVTITATSNSDPTQSASATVTIVPPQAAGYNLAWQDTFSSLSLCTINVPGCNWYDPGLWWETAPGTVTDPSGTYVNLGWASGQANSTNISTASPNGAYSNSWTYGYFEISMAFDPTTGSAPAIWMLPTSEIGADTSSNGIDYGELDLFEWQSQTPKTFYGTVHVWNNQVDIANNNSSDGWTLPTGTNFANYNTYGVLWTLTSISWYFNNVLIEIENTTSTPYSKVFNGLQSYFLILSQQADCNWTSPCSGQASPLNIQVQWVHVYAPPTT